MPSFRINQTDGTISPTTGIELEVLSFFADDAASVPQGIWLIRNEYSRYQEDPENWAFSKFSMNVIDATMNRAAQIYVCGVVALIMVHLREDGLPASLNQSSRVASELFNETNTALFRMPKAQEWVNRRMSLTGDQTSIKKIFRQYRSCAHICAAKILAEDADKLAHPMERPLPATLTYVSTVLYYQNLFSSWPKTKDWNLWQVWHEGGSFAEKYPPKTMPSDVLERIKKVEKSLSSSAE